MREILYREVTAQDTASVLAWLHLEWQPTIGKKVITPDGIRLQFSQDTSKRSQTIPESELSIFVWSVQRTTYLKVFRWGEQDIREQNRIVQQLIADLSDRFPQRYPKPPEINLKKQSIFEALDPYYPKTVHFFQKMPKGEYDLQRAYWWEQRWRESVNNPQQPKQVVFKKSEVGANGRSPSPEYDLIYIGGALGAIHAAVMAKLGYKVLIIERLPFGRMNREWNISRSEFQNLIDLGLFTAQEFESLIAREYVDGFNKFLMQFATPFKSCRFTYSNGLEYRDRIG